MDANKDEQFSYTLSQPTPIFFPGWLCISTWHSLIRNTWSTYLTQSLRVLVANKALRAGSNWLYRKWNEFFAAGVWLLWVYRASDFLDDPVYLPVISLLLISMSHLHRPWDCRERGDEIVVPVSCRTLNLAVDSVSPWKSWNDSRAGI